MMNSRTRLRFDPPDHSRAFSDYYTSKQLPDRASLTAAVTAVVVIATLAFNLLRSPTLSRRVQSLAHVLWDCIVALTPVFLIHALDRFMNPPMFPGLPPVAPPSTHAEKSEKMATLLGANKAAGVIRSLSTGFPRPTFPSGTLRTGLLNFGASKDQPAGLGNLDNSCYQNSILQGLASLDHLSPYLERNLRGRSEGLETARTLRDLISRLKDAENNGRTLWTPRILKNMCSFQQQDAQEYYAKILDEIDKEISKAGVAAPASPESVDSVNDDTSLHSDDSGYASSTSIASKKSAEPPQNPLEGLLAQRVACTQCGYSEGLSLIPFNCLTINLGLNTPGHDLYERLDSYTDLEAIEGVECPRCTLLKLQRLLRTLAGRLRQSESAAEHRARVEDRLGNVEAALEDEAFDDETMRGKCKVTAENRANVLKTKQAVVARPPKSLAVHVNRSVFDERTGMLFKNPAAVQFPTTLDLGPWCLGSRATPGAKEGVDSGIEEEAWGLGPRISMVAGENRQSLISGPIYELRAVVTHYGHHNNGHYICYRKHASGPPPTLDEPEGKGGGGVEVEEGAEEATWWRLSDESVRKVPEDVVMAQGGVFMLFYDCVDGKLVRTDGEGETLVGGCVGVSLDGTDMGSAEMAKGEDVKGHGVLASAEGSRTAEEQEEMHPGKVDETGPSSEEIPRADEVKKDEDVKVMEAGPDKVKEPEGFPAETPRSHEEQGAMKGEMGPEEAKEPALSSADPPGSDDDQGGKEVGDEAKEPVVGSEETMRGDDVQREGVNESVLKSTETPRADDVVGDMNATASGLVDATETEPALDAADGEPIDGTAHAGGK